MAESNLNVNNTRNWCTHQPELHIYVGCVNILIAFVMMFFVGCSTNTVICDSKTDHVTLPHTHCTKSRYLDVKFALGFRRWFFSFHTFSLVRPKRSDSLKWSHVIQYLENFGTGENTRNQLKCTNFMQTTEIFCLENSSEIVWMFPYANTKHKYAQFKMKNRKP